MVPLLALCATLVDAAQIDVVGPPGSGKFGTTVSVLANGNFVVTDPFGPVSNVGAVYLYGAGGGLLSTITGSSAEDQVGSGGITQLANGHFVISSPRWKRGLAPTAGAVTWANGNSGISGVVSESNSLVGTFEDDRVGAVTALSNGNYVVRSPLWNNGATSNAGAVTWADGAAGRTGLISASNSLIGGTASDQVGSVSALANGNYVVRTTGWDDNTSLPVTTNAGAVTWANGNSGISGFISPANSLVGSTDFDAIATSVRPLADGNFVLESLTWDAPGIANAGAISLLAGDGELTGFLTPANSVLGSVANGGSNLPNLPFDYDPTRLRLVVGRPDSNLVSLFRLSSSTNGASTRAAEFDISGPLGSVAFGRHVAVLANGNIVVTDPSGPASNVGAVYLYSPDGILISTLTGSSANSNVGSGGITRLANGNFVVLSPFWGDGVTNELGAATWASGVTGISGVVSAANSLIGSRSGDMFLGLRVTALTNGNYVVVASTWSNGNTSSVGAVAWANGESGGTGVISASNALIGTSAQDQVGRDGVVALANGNYVVASGVWNNGAVTAAGAVTWANGSTGLSGIVSASNSLVGSTSNDQIGGAGVTTLANGDYTFRSAFWDAPGVTNAGAVTLASGTLALSGFIHPGNSVLGTVSEGGISMTFDYDAVRERLVVGRPSSNLVSLFTLPQSTLIFTDGFE